MADLLFVHVGYSWCWRMGDYRTLLVRLLHLSTVSKVKTHWPTASLLAPRVGAQRPNFVCLASM